jgi:hypothetical protein
MITSTSTQREMDQSRVEAKVAAMDFAVQIAWSASGEADRAGNCRGDFMNDQSMEAS